MEKNKKITLIGCGNIGSRHLQAIVKLKESITIEIVEPDLKAQKLAKSRLNEIKYNEFKHTFFWHKSLSKIKNKSDLVIVATNSKGRINLIEKLLCLDHKRFIIESLIFGSRLATGSSARRRVGFFIIALAIPTLCCCPPESLSTLE